MNNTSAITALREAADWLEQHPELPPVYVGDIALFVTWKGDAKENLRTVVHAMGKAAKFYTDSSVIVRKHFGTDGANIAWCSDRDKVCERVVVGTKVIPATPETVTPAQPEKVVEVVEWHCAPILAVQHA